jgi:transposase
MIDKQTILLGYHRHGKSKKQLSRELGLSLTTIKKYLKAHEAEMAQSGQDPSKLPLHGIVQPPRYNSSKREKRKFTSKIIAEIDEYLVKNQKKRDQGRHKQLMKAKDIHEALAKAGHDIGYRSVCRYVREQTAKSKEVFIRQQYIPGQATEFDWGEVKLSINGKTKTFMLAVFTSCFSNHRWARLYHRQDTSSFLDSHAQYFSFTGGVHGQVIYDNMRTAVRQFAIRNTDKKPTIALLKMSCYYKFDYRFCNARKGNEKGHVERSVEYLRRKAFAPLDDFNSIASANTHLLQTCEYLNQKPLTGKTTPIQTVFEEELQHMKASQSTPFDSSELTSLRVDKYSCVKVDTNWYSVTEGYVGQMIDVKIYPNKILAYNAKNELIATHLRKTTRYEYFINIDHYLKTLVTKPGALSGSVGLKQADLKLQNIFSTHFSNRPKLLVDLLLYLRKFQYDLDDFSIAVDQCLAICPHQEVSVDKVKIFLQKKDQKQETLPPLKDTQSLEIAAHCARQLSAQQALIFQS